MPAITEQNALYARASSDPKESLSSVSDQRTAGFRWAETNDRRKPKAFVDNDISASGEKHRPAFAELREFIATKKVGHVIAFTSSRLTRNRREFVAFLDLCSERGTKLVLDGKVYDPADPTDVFALGIFNQFDSYLLDVIRKNVRLALNSNAEQGKPHGHIPFGYERVYDARTGRVETQVPHPVEAPQFVRYVEAVLDGSMSVADVAQEMGRTATTVRVMMANPTYIAKRVHKPKGAPDSEAKVYPGNWQPLITEDQHRALVRLFSRTAKGPRRTPARKFPYTGLLVCSECGAKLTMRDGNKVDAHARYVCSNSRCRKVAIRRDLFDPWFEARLNEAIVEGVKVAGNPDDDTTALVELRARYDKLVDRRATIIDTFDEDDDPAEVKALLAKNKAAIAEVQAEIDEQSESIDMNFLLDANGLPLDLTADDVTDDVRSHMAAYLVNSVTVHPNGKGRKLVDVRNVISPDDLDWR